MKRLICILFAVVLMAAGCSSKTENDPQESATTQDTTQVSTAEPTAEPTEEPTPSPEPAPTPDVDPASKLLIGEEEFAAFLELWPAKTSPLSEHGTVKRFSINAQTGFESSTVNFMFAAEKSKTELEEMYMTLVTGEWETSEYSAGPTVYGGLLEDEIDTTCQISTIDGKNEVFMGMYIDTGAQLLEDAVSAHWPIAFIDMPKDMASDTLYFNEMVYEPGTSITFVQTYEPSDLNVAMEFFKEALSVEELYVFTERGEYTGASITCMKEGIIIKISESMETRIAISLTVNIK